MKLNLEELKNQNSVIVLKETEQNCIKGGDEPKPLPKDGLDSETE